MCALSHFVFEELLEVLVLDEFPEVHNGGAVGDGTGRGHVAADGEVAHGRHEGPPQNVQRFGVVVAHHQSKVRDASALRKASAGARIWNRCHVRARVDFHVIRHC